MVKMAPVAAVESGPKLPPWKSTWTIGVPKAASTAEMGRISTSVLRSTRQIYRRYSPWLLLAYSWLNLGKRTVLME